MPVEAQDVSNLETPWQYGKALNACKRSHSWQQALSLLVEAEGKGLANAVLFCSTLGACDGAKWRTSSEVLRRFGKSRIRGAGERDKIRGLVMPESVSFLGRDAHQQI